jgi:hypothetical protein
MFIQLSGFSVIIAQQGMYFQLEEYYFIREDNTGEENVQVNEIKNED